jgi:succinylarginine dihydrolase
MGEGLPQPAALRAEGPVREANFDGIVGPTHNYAGLSYGNVASQRNEGAVSHPRAAALQGLAKMSFVASLGIEQGYLPPHERPHLPTLRRLGFHGSDAAVLAEVAKADPTLLARVSSASPMWTANAATVAPSRDAADGRVHFTPANLRAMFHRSIEPAVTARVLAATFPDANRFTHHEPLPAAELLGDEGAANHTRFDGPDGKGVHLFVYGRSEREPDAPRRYPARQTLNASEAVARLHGLDPSRTVFARQRADSIDAGVFHNDVIAVGAGRTLLTHEHAFAEREKTLAELRERIPGLVVVEVRMAEVPVETAVRTYLFNSQLLERPDGRLALVLPVESREDPAVASVVDRIVSDPANPIAEAHFLDVRESMRNGGGPACLRLRVPLEDAELAAVNPGSRFSPGQHATLEDWVRRRYREDLRAADLADPALLVESRDALDELTRILGIGNVYDFQR